ncbi:EAL domain-containing protein [Pseudidiomarina gelatinasegens]|uniref:EAL domain-containing protein n=1 Tax=Pseudidiomarina gelatinasegens TaxID=2487740 RepID=UPI003A97DD54
MATCGKRLIVSFLVCCGVLPLASFAAPAELTFVGSKFYPPLQWLDENNQPQGFIVELEQSLANQGGFSLTQTLLPWNEALQAVRTGQADAVALIPSEARSEYFDFSEPFYYVAHGIFSHSNGIQYGNYAQLEGKKVAVASGAFAQQQLRDSGYSFELISASDELHCLQLVDSRAADACIEVTTTSRHLITNNKLQVALSSPPFWPQSYAFGVRKGNKELLALIDKQLAMIQVNGTYQNIYQKWVTQLEWQERTFASNLKALGWLLFGIVSIAAVGFGWSYVLKKQVALKTYRIQQELDARKVLQKRLHFLAKHEVITGLYNRPAFTELLDKQIKEHPEDHPTVIVIRIANIDSITSVFGYDITTDLLIEFSERLKKQGFKYAAHFGVGLFAAVADSELSTEAIIDLAMQPLEFKSIDFEPLLAFGLIRNKDFGTIQSNDAQELLRQALTAVSVSQKDHKLWVEYSPGLEPNADDLRLLKDFHQYGTRDFFLHYQPKLTLETNTILGAEALVRWQHPTLGIVPPSKFIPLMEESGLVTQITRWVITETIAMMKRHKLCQKGIVISVNVSTRDLTELGFVRFVQDIVTDIDPKCLQFEITETGLIDDSERALYVLSKMNELGISCSVDDFGTGNSSLSYLSKFPVAEIKLDRSYVFDIAENDRNNMIVRSTIELAHMLGISVTAEGVEDIATIDVLREFNCETIQGFVISRPISENEVVEMFLKKIKI